jgi:hypothetical protein
MSRLTVEQVAQYEKSIDREIKEAEQHLGTNRFYEIVFRVITFLIGAGIVATSAIAASGLYQDAARQLSAASAILGGLLTAVSGFAFEQFNFGKRRATYAAKAAELKSLRDELILQPKARAFQNALRQVRRWDDDNAPTQVRPLHSADDDPADDEPPLKS